MCVFLTIQNNLQLVGNAHFSCSKTDQETVSLPDNSERNEKICLSVAAKMEDKHKPNLATCFVPPN